MKSSLWEIILSLEVGNFISPFLGNLHLPFTLILVPDFMQHPKWMTFSESVPIPPGRRATSGDRRRRAEPERLLMW